MPTGPRRPPIINAPLAVTATALTLCLAHLARVLAPDRLQSLAIYHGALFPERFWGWVRGDEGPAGALAYPNAAEAIFPLAASALLHGDIMHVVLNALFLLALGKPLHDLFRSASDGRRGRATLLFLLLALIAQIAGGMAFLAVQGPDGSLGIGSSGAVSGLLGAVLLVFTGGGRLSGRAFLSATAIFIAANAILALIGPSLLGASIAWESHAGGYLAGALAMRFWLQVSAGKPGR